MDRELRSVDRNVSRPGDEMLGPDLDAMTRKELRRILRRPEYPDDPSYFLWRHRRDLDRGRPADTLSGLLQRLARRRS
jgi:hypothetical protein